MIKTKTDKKKSLSIVIPVFNEDEVLNELIIRLKKLITLSLSKNILINVFFVDDGSIDKSLDILEKASKNNTNFKVISFSRNFGHQIAVSAGLEFADGDFIAIIDADLQDPPELILGMFDLLKNKKVEVVYGQRIERKGETFFKKFSANLFYKLLNKVTDFEIPHNTGDFRLITKRVKSELLKMGDNKRFIRGMIPWIGFKSVPFFYDREERFAGKTKYSISAMVKFAQEGVFTFSTKPLKIAITLGLLTITFGFVGLLYILYIKFFTNQSVPGITTILFAISIFGGVQLFITGILGAYLGYVFEQVKGRPLYVIKNLYNINDL